jgi:UDP-galactopyranose mutase
MSRFSRKYRTLFWEEPLYHDGPGPAGLDVRVCPETGVEVATPMLPVGLARAEELAVLRRLLDGILAPRRGPLVRWYYTPMMLPFSEHVPADCVVYDCMDELANFKGAPPELIPSEQRLFEQADMVLTGGYSLYEAKRDRHANIHPFPSSVDVAHFGAARAPGLEPQDQAELPGPRLGFYGVVDERMDLDLLARLADARPQWSIVIVGPVVKISEDDLPRRPNLHYLGGKTYAELPNYLRGWDVALMPFAINEATRFISPTKTPEYLAAGCPVVSTSIRDVVRPYADLGLVHIADDADGFVAALDRAMSEDAFTRQAKVEACLAGNSWDATWTRMDTLICAACSSAAAVATSTASVAHV